jgi:hypothetical protein
MARVIAAAGSTDESWCEEVTAEFHLLAFVATQRKAAKEMTRATIVP